MELEEQEINLQECLRLGQDILRQCHPDALTTVRHWLTVLQARWDEVLAFANQRENMLTGSLTDLRQNEALLEELLQWLLGAGAQLQALDAKPVPDNIPIIEQLLHDHAVSINYHQPHTKMFLQALTTLYLSLIS